MDIYVFYLVYLLVLAFNIWIFFIAPKRALSERLATVLQFVAVYTFCFGVVAKVGVLPALGGIDLDLTSPNVFSFVSANLQLAAIAAGGLGIAMDPAKTGLTASLMVQGVFLLLLAPVVLAGLLAYVVFVLPWAYLAYVFVSIPVDAILTAGRDICITTTVPGHSESSYCVKQAMEANTVAFKNFLVAVPAVALAFGLKVLREAGQVLAERVSGSMFEWARKPVAKRAVRYGLAGLQAFATLILVTSAALGLGSLSVIKAHPGEVFGMTLALVLILVLEFLMVTKLGRWRRAL